MLLEHLWAPSVTDFWGIVFPAYLGAAGGILSGVIALIALFVSIRNRGGVRSIQNSLNSANGTEVVETHSGTANLSSSVTLTAEGSASMNASDSTAPVLWGVERDGRRYRLVNRSTATAAVLISAEDVSEDGDNAFQMLPELPVRVEPGASLPFIIEKSMVSPAVTAIRITWTEGASPARSVTLYV